MFTDTQTNDNEAKRIRSVEYTKLPLKKYGNVYISKQTQKLWEGYDLAGYLTDLIGETIILRECHSMPDGCVAEVNWRTTRG